MAHGAFGVVDLKIFLRPDGWCAADRDAKYVLVVENGNGNGKVQLTECVQRWTLEMHCVTIGGVVICCGPRTA